MDILASIRKMLVPIHREGYVFILAGLAAMLVLGWVWQPLFWLCGVITSWIIYFFRDPPRVTPLGEGLIALTARLGIDAPGAKAVFYGLTLIAIIYARPNGVWPWLARLLGLKERAS